MHHLNQHLAVSVHETQGDLFVRLPLVVRRTGLGRSTIYRLIAEQKFPRQVKLAARAVGWRQADLDRWIEARVAVSP